jgi:hypothetical protein
MANAVETAPEKKVLIDDEEVMDGSDEHKALSQKFDARKKYMFQLADENPVREYPVIDMRTKRAAPHKKFNPFRNLVFTSQIVWNGSRRMIRYYDGCTTIFSDKQPKDKDVVDTLIKQSKKRSFNDGKFGCYGDERMLLLYLNICSWNAESLFRTRTADTVFVAVNADKEAENKSSRLDKIEEALRYAKDASVTKMKIHGAFLGISDTDWDSGNEISEKEFRVLYREIAADDPEGFIKSYGNKSIEVRYYIDSALKDGTINNKSNPNKAMWKSGKDVCDISGLKSNDAISQRIFEFSQTEDGAEFLLQLRALYEKKEDKK